MQTANADVKGSKDHPLIGRFDGSTIKVFKAIEFDEFPFMTGPYDSATKSVAKTETLEGKLTLIGYRLPKGTSYTQVARNFKLGMQDKGFEFVFECDTKKRDCGDGSYGALEFAQRLRKPTDLPEAGVYDWDRWKYHYLAAKLERPEGNVFATVWVTKYSNAEEPKYVYVSVLEQEAMAFKMVDASEMASEIANSGRIALYGIYFDTNKAEVKAESKPTMEQIAKLLSDNPDLRLVVVGHTDNQGKYDYNMDLSTRRATSVKNSLIGDFGIAAERLEAWGAGYLAPVASNSSEEGRAQNRRVELVKR
jgi:outer membrane protein OmpA-like peptidoglycan-associated protein